jgi:hypothetical protein
MNAIFKNISQSNNQWFQFYTKIKKKKANSILVFLIFNSEGSSQAWLSLNQKTLQIYM